MIFELVQHVLIVCLVAVFFVAEWWQERKKK
jgi:hypothetical protein